MITRLTDCRRMPRAVSFSENHTARVGSRSIYILPTGAGLVYGLLLVALLITAINYGNNLVFVLTFLLGGVGIAAMFRTWQNLRGLEIGMRPPKPVFAGETSRFPVILRAASRGPRDAIEMRLRDQPAVMADFDDRAHRSLNLPAVTRRRGYIEADCLIVSSRYPLGLFNAWTLMAAQARGLVYPAPLRGHNPVAGGSGDGFDAGSRGRDGEDFDSLRPYRRGDSLQRISWKATARARQIHTKQFGGEQARVHWFNWDEVPATDPEIRLRILTAWVLDAAARGSDWGIRIPGVALGPATGPRHRDRCLTALACHGLPLP
ncbi:MAG: DUF58 domain-containing protein [Pseudomonadota bacterium]